MKRYACHLLYIAPNISLKKQVVEIDSKGLCTSYYDLSEEQSFTEWVGGIFALFPMDFWPCEKECLCDAWKRISIHESDNKRVWRITGLRMQSPDIQAPCSWLQL